MRLESCLEGDE
jgi:hypothetical protein